MTEGELSAAANGGDPVFGAEHGAVGDGRLKRMVLRLAPGRRRHLLLGALRGARHHGDRVECPCCESTFSRFLPHRGRPHARCPRCGALERHRVLWLFLEQETDLLDRGGAMLHIAPEYALMRRLSRVEGLSYLSGDLDSALADRRLDAMDLPFEDGAFDFLICNHVLEHVEDDGRALAEFNRVLRPDGWAILMCPVDRRLATTREDPAIVSPADRHRAFGQGDHRRLYGRDYASRLVAAGFEVSRIPYLDRFDEPTIARLGLRRERDEAFGEEDVFLCERGRHGGRSGPGGGGSTALAARGRAPA